MFNLFKRRPKPEPDIDKFLDDLRRSVNPNVLDGPTVAAVFRRAFTHMDPTLRRQVLFILLSWCEEYEFKPPVDPAALQRWAGKREIAGKIKAAMHADLDTPTTVQGEETDDRRADD